jgi:ABC-type multidrug transport system fused ATPase/permease subunit
MNRQRSYWLVMALLVAACLASVILPMVSPGGFDAPSSGDLVASSFGPASLTLFLMGVLLLVGTKILRTRSRRAHARQPSQSASTTRTGATVRI